MFGAGWPYVAKWGDDASVPDITQLETQLYYYYLATEYLGAGFESIWLGQIYLTAANDHDYSYTHSLVQRLRAFAATHTRRNFALIVSHQLGDVEFGGEDVFDFNFMVAIMKIDELGRMVARLPDSAYFDCDAEPGVCAWLDLHPLDYDKPLLVMFDNGVPNPLLDDADEISYFDMQKPSERHRYLHRTYFELPLQFSKARFAMPGIVLAPYVPKDGSGFPYHCPDAAGNFAYHGTWDYEARRCGDLPVIRTLFKQWDYLHTVPMKLHHPQNTIDVATPVFDWEPVYGAEAYEVYCHNNSTDTPVFHVPATASTYAASEVLSAGNYAWIVRYYQNGAWSDWSEPLSFQVTPP